MAELGTAITSEEEEQIVRGLLPFKVNGQTLLVPELKWRANREWQDRLQAAFASLVAMPADTPAGQQAMADAERELVLAYDATHVLGDLEDATEREIDAIYTRLMEIAFPLAQSQVALVVGMVKAAQSALESSTSGQSPTGTSGAPTTLKPRSPAARSSSSSRRRRSA